MPTITRTDEPLHISEDQLAEALAVVEEEFAKVGVAHDIKISEWIDPELDEDFSTMIWASLKEPTPIPTYMAILREVRSRLACAGLLVEDDESPLNFTVSPQWSLPPTS